MNKNRKYILTALGVGILALAYVFWPRSQPPQLVIVDGVPYQLLSYSTVESKLSNASSTRTMEAYIWTIAYPKQEQKLKGTTRGTIMVPKFAVRRDFDLPLNTVVWDGSIVLEGKTYGVVRWNPAHDVPAIDNPTLVPEPPLTRTQ